VNAPDEEMTLAQHTALRFILAGITWDDPGLVKIREWNAVAFERAGLPDPHGP
jgi:hypothetical protein